MKVDFRSVDWLQFFRGYGLVPRAKRQRRNKGAELVNVYAAFDIETSTIYGSSGSNTDAHAFMYIWQFQIEDYLIIGRTWEEWLECLAILKRALEQYSVLEKIANIPMMVIWIHNAAFEFSYISGIYQFTDEECFFRDARKPIYFRMFNAFEFRCSYIQTNLSLKALKKLTGVPV